MVVEEKERGVGSTVEDDCRTRGSTAVTHFKGSLYPGPQLQHPHIFSFRASRYGVAPLRSANFLLFPQSREFDTGALSWKSFNLQPYISVRIAVSSRAETSTFGVRPVSALHGHLLLVSSRERNHYSPPNHDRDGQKDAKQMNIRKRRDLNPARVKPSPLRM